MNVDRTLIQTDGLTCFLKCCKNRLDQPEGITPLTVPLSRCSFNLLWGKPSLKECNFQMHLLLQSTLRFGLALYQLSALFPWVQLFLVVHIHIQDSMWRKFGLGQNIFVFLKKDDTAALLNDVDRTNLVASGF